MNRKFSLKKNHEIEKLLKNKHSVGNKYYAIYYQYSNEKLPKFAFSVSKRFKTAVNRNYEKRVTKEIFRPLLPSLSGLRMLVVIKESAKDLSFEDKKTQINYLINKILRSNNEKAR